jgi:hypothetical protein
MFPVVLGLSLINGLPVLDMVKVGVTLALLAVLAFMVFKNAPPGTSLSTNFGVFQEKAVKLLTFIDGWGFGSVFKPLLTDVAQGNFAAVPGHFLAVLNSIDDKQSRGQMLDAHFYSDAGIERQLADPDRQAKLLQLIQQRLDVVIQPKAAPPKAAT